MHSKQHGFPAARIAVRKQTTTQTDINKKEKGDILTIASSFDTQPFSS